MRWKSTVGFLSPSLSMFFLWLPESPVNPLSQMSLWFFQVTLKSWSHCSMYLWPTFSFWKKLKTGSLGDSPCICVVLWSWLAGWDRLKRDCLSVSVCLNEWVSEWVNDWLFVSHAGILPRQGIGEMEAKVLVYWEGIYNMYILSHFSVVIENVVIHDVQTFCYQISSFFNLVMRVMNSWYSWNFNHLNSIDFTELSATSILTVTPYARNICILKALLVFRVSFPYFTIRLN